MASLSASSTSTNQGRKKHSRYVLNNGVQWRTIACHPSLRDVDELVGLNLRCKGGHTRGRGRLRSEREGSQIVNVGRLRPGLYTSEGLVAFALFGSSVRALARMAEWFAESARPCASFFVVCGRGRIGDLYREASGRDSCGRVDQESTLFSLYPFPCLVTTE